MSDNEPIVREPREGEFTKIGNILKKYFGTFNMGAVFRVLTVPGKGDKRILVGVVGVIEGNRICQLVVSKDYRRHGYGTMLLREAMKLATKPSHLRVRWWNWKAIRLYWKMGFRPSGMYKFRSLVMTLPVAKVKKPKPVKPKIEKPVVVPKPLTIPFTPILWEREVKRILHPQPFNVLQRIEIIKLRPQKINRGLIVPGNFMDFVRLDQMIPVENNRPLVPEEIAQHLYGSKGFEGNDWSVYDILQRMKPDSWQEWETSEGKWTTRFEKYMYKNYNQKVLPTTLRIIGDYVSEALKHRSMNIMITRTFNQKDKDKFGDRGSCWYGGQSRHPNCLFRKKGPGYILKVFRGETPNSRAWMYYKNNSFYLFNLRGPATKFIPELLSEYMGGMEVRKVDLSVNRGQHDHYIDSGVSFYGVGLNPQKSLVMNWCKDD